MTAILNTPYQQSYQHCLHFQYTHSHINGKLNMMFTVIKSLSQGAFKSVQVNFCSILTWLCEISENALLNQQTYYLL